MIITWGKIRTIRGMRDEMEVKVLGKFLGFFGHMWARVIMKHDYAGIWGNLGAKTCQFLTHNC